MNEIREEELIEVAESFEQTLHSGKGYFPATTQLRHLGIDDFVGSLIGLRVLDIGSGQNAKLVGYLRERGVLAEGIDPDLEIEGDHLMKLSIGHPEINGMKIPRPDRHYDLVLIHSIPGVYKGLSGIPRVAENNCLEGMLIVEEGLRVLKNGGELRTYPVTRELAFLRMLAYKISERKEKIRGGDLFVQNMPISFLEKWGADPETIREIYSHTTILRKS